MLLYWREIGLINYSNVTLIVLRTSSGAENTTASDIYRYKTNLLVAHHDELGVCI